ncbi:type IVB secretion system apparatus protein IcmL/DotI [Paracoccus litorisediminis]|uniref:type IVB secretion system apparatus protein IcmL/DotI n=1 Tax=Paracoccus litorisediminis TaxID=2006130 RepID=UPI00372FEE6A
MIGRKRHGASETVLNRHETYREALKRSGITNMLLAAVSVLSVGMAWNAMSKQPQPKYFMTGEDGRIIPMVAVNQPFLSDGQVINFAVEAITRSMTMNFVTWRQDMGEASEYFERPNGWNNFVKAITDSGTLDLIKNRRLISSAVANGAVIVKQGPENGRFTWLVQVPLTITYQSSSEQSTENRMAEIEIARLPTWQTPHGAGITRVILK